MANARFVTVVAALLLAVCASGATFTVTNINDSGPGSLRQAILDANVAGGTVAFNIPNAPRTIALSSGLPLAEAGVIIDGTTQPGYLGAPVVEISGANIPNAGLQACVSNVLNAAGKIARIGPSVIVAATGPSISSLSIACGLTDGGAALVIHGSGFEPGATVTFDGTFAHVL